MRIGLIFGLISGAICGMMFYISTPTDGNFDFEKGHLYGYITMFIALSTIFFAVKQYRDKHLQGDINFGKALLVGLYVTFVAGIVYVLAWEVYFSQHGGDFVEQYTQYMNQQLVDQGLAQEEIDTQLADHTAMMRDYENNTPMRMGFTFLEILPVGVIISLISAGLFGFVFSKRSKQSK